jgi:hypothetical protein
MNLGMSLIYAVINPTCHDRAPFGQTARSVIRPIPVHS